MSTARVVFAGGANPDDAIATVLEAMDISLDDRVTSVLPALPASDMALARTVTAAFQRSNHRAAVVPAPSLLMALRASIGREQAHGWFTARHGEQLWRLPDSLDSSHRIVAAALLDSSERKGALFLDVLARYLALADRARVFATKAGPVDVNLGRRPNLCIAACRIEQRVLALASTDLIAAELVAIGLLGHLSGTADEQAGPWEDALVQRATEFELGARLPAEMQLHVAPQGEMTETMASVIRSVARRLGIRDTALSSR